jgi:decaprenylphospho-beta-D-erythro-pentofuranosid-2-ulose 2-reductase
VNRRILVIGATSAIAGAVARRYAAQGGRLYLLARRAAAVDAAGADLRVRGAADVRTGIADALDTASMPAVLEAAWSAWDGFDVVLLAFGVLPDQAQCEGDLDSTLEAFDTNGRAAIAWLTLLANRLAAQGKGTIGVISSPAGDRGRASNYVYGASKAALTAFASGLRQRLRGAGVKVVTILPGFVDTPMTASFRKGPIWASPDRVAADIVRALERGTPIVYTPWFWRWIMAIILHIPERIFVRLKL